MNPEELARRHPLLYHMAELNSWPSIQRHGLRSTSALLDLFGTTGPSRFQIESQWRPASVTLSHQTYGTAIIRDQLPMREDRLRDCLVDMTTRQWYELINGKTFFWPNETPLTWMLNAAPYRAREHAVIVVPTQTLLAHRRNIVTLSAINSGSVYPSKATGTRQARGPSTFQPIQHFADQWLRELAVDYSVPNIVDLAVRVEARRGTRRPRVIWRQDLGQ